MLDTVEASRVKDVMAAERMIKLSAEYIGAGDSGEVTIHAVTYKGHPGEETLGDTDPAAEKLKELIWGIVQSNYPGFENSDGLYNGAEGIIEVEITEDGKLAAYQHHRPYEVELEYNEG